MFLKYSKYFLFALILIIIQKTFIPLISIDLISPDLIFLLIIFISIGEGQIAGMLFGFFIGLVQDIIFPGFIGLSSLSYCIGGFIAGYFYEQYRYLVFMQSYFFIFIIFLSSLISNIIYFAFFVLGSDLNYWALLLQFGIGSTLYTMIIGIILVFIFSKKLVRLPQEIAADD